MDFFLPALQRLFEPNPPPLWNAEIQARIQAFYRCLIEANQKLNLTRITNEPDFYQRHILDAWSLFKVLPQNQLQLSLLDLGTGGGIPGIPLWLIQPQWNYCLVDAVEKKLTAIDIICQTLKKEFPTLAPGPTTRHGRAEELGQSPDFREQFDRVVARALAPLAVLLEYALPLVKVGGDFIAMKSSDYHQEIVDSQGIPELLGAQLKQICPYTLPDRQAVLLVYTKTGHTPIAYPRANGKPKKHPLKPR